MVQAFQRLHLQLDSAGQWIAISKTVRRQQLVRAIGYILFPFLVGIVIVRNSSKVINELKTRSAMLAKELVGDVVSDKAELQSFADNLKQYPTYLIWSMKEGILKQLDDYSRTVNELQRSRSLPREMQLAESIKLVSKIQSQIQSYNEEFVKRRRREYAPLFTKASVHLDDSQLDAIITDDQHNCVIACAGSGKTEVLINRIAYLVCRNPDTIDPNRVLALAFQRNAAREIEARLRERFSVSVKVKTFHALGLEILRTAGTPAELKFDSDAGYSEFIDGLFRKREREPEFLNLLISYMKNFDSSPPRPESDFETREEFYRFMRNQSYVALNGVQVKSEAEKAILNFFLSHRLNGREVDIRYEAKASWMQYRNNKNQIITPRPDFYLPDFDVYIEHWAVDAAGNAPRWFADASQYKLTMEKKRAAYKTHRKTLIETTAADFNKEDFEETLQGRTAAALNSQFPMVRFAFTSVPYEELVEKAYYELRMAVRELPYNISRFIVVAKTYALTPDAIERKLDRLEYTRQQKAFALIALRIFRDYEESLKTTGEIDFADMINHAVETLTKNDELYRDVLDHILVDEYQDLSTQRFRLLKALLDRNPHCKLFAVGDDWQSIMGFAGSNLDFTLRFGDYFDHPAVTYLHTNYRSASSIVNLGSAVISHNKSRLPKDTFSSSNAQPPIILHNSQGDKYDWDGHYNEMVEHCTSKIREYLDMGYRPSDMMILVRIAKNPRLINRLIEAGQRRGIKISTSRRNPYALPVISVHKSKGLQARIVFLLNVIDHMYGFPCTIEDLDLLAPAMEGIPRPRIEEERRLFYVAVTRARERLTIYSQSCRPSRFIEEVRNHLREDTQPGLHNVKSI